MQFKIMIIFALLCIGLVGSYIIFKNTKSKRDTNAFTIGIAAGYAPFISINEKGEYEGFDIDFAHALASTMGKKLVLKDLGTMTSLIIALEQGSIDAIIWGISITQERLKKFAMIHYQGETETAHPLLFWKAIPENIKSLSDMKGMKVCVEPSSFQSTILNKYKDIAIIPTEKVDDALLNIQFGKADAALVDPAIAQKFKAKYPELKILDVPLEKEDQVQGMGVALKQGNTTLIKLVQNAITQLKYSGIIKQYEKKWRLE